MASKSMLLSLKSAVLTVRIKYFKVIHLNKLIPYVMFFTQFFIGLTALSFASIMPLVAVDLGVTSEHMQYQASLSYAGVFLSQICLMIIVQFVGIKRSYLIGLSIGVTFFTGLILTSNYAWFMLFLMLSKCGFALAYGVPAIILKKMNYSSQAFSSYYGAILAGFSLGTMLSPPLSAWVSLRYTWQFMATLLCLFGLLVMILLAAIIPNIPQEKKPVKWLQYQLRLVKSKHFVPLVVLFNTTSNYLVVINYAFSLLLVEYYQLPIKTTALYLMMANTFVIVAGFSVRLFNHFLSPMGFMALAATLGCVMMTVMGVSLLLGFDHPILAICAACCFAWVRGLSQPNIVVSALSDIELPSEIIMPSLIMWSAIPTIITASFIASLDDDMISFVGIFLMLLCVHVSALFYHYSLKQHQERALWLN